MNKKDLLKDLTDNTNAATEQYESNVVLMIRERYTINDELSILRKHLSRLNDDEFEEYNTYVEECKRKAKGK